MPAQKQADNNTKNADLDLGGSRSLNETKTANQVSKGDPIKYCRCLECCDYFNLRTWMHQAQRRRAVAPLPSVAGPRVSLPSPQDRWRGRPARFWSAAWYPIFLFLLLIGVGIQRSLFRPEGLGMDVLHERAGQNSADRRNSEFSAQQQRQQQIHQLLKNRQKPPKHLQGSQYLDFDPNFCRNFTLPGRPEQPICVGRQGPAVTRAIQHGMPQRAKGHAREYFDTLATQSCITTKTTNSKAGTAAKNSNQTVPATNKASRFRLPSALLLGVQKGGTTALYRYLKQHPQFAKLQKELYFLDERIDKMILSIAASNASKAYIPQHKAQQAYHAVLSSSMSASVSQRPNDRRSELSKPQKQKDESLIMDLTPNYLFYSDRVPQRIGCLLSSDSKLLVLLRNPVERARSQYDMKLRFVTSQQPGIPDPDHVRQGSRETSTLNSFGNPIPSLDEYIQNDIDALLETGVFQDWSKVDFDEFWDSPALWEAWRTYVNSGLNAPVGMGLYAMQLKPFLDLPHPLLAVPSEELQSKPSDTYQKVLEFLGLSSHTLEHYDTVNGAKEKQIMSQETHDRLVALLQPFHRKLVELLGEDWERVWKMD